MRLVQKHELREILGAPISILVKVLNQHSKSITGRNRRYERFSVSRLQKIRKIYINILTFGSMYV